MLILDPYGMPFLAVLVFCQGLTFYLIRSDHTVTHDLGAYYYSSRRRHRRRIGGERSGKAIGWRQLNIIEKCASNPSLAAADWHTCCVATFVCSTWCE